MLRVSEICGRSRIVFFRCVLIESLALSLPATATVVFADDFAGATENAGVEKVARSDTGGKRGSNQHRTLRKCNEASQAGPPRKMYERRMSHPADN